MESEEISDVNVADYQSKNVESRQEYNCPAGICDGFRKGNGTDDDRVSMDSTLSDLQTFELPQDIPDGPQFQDLGAYIDSVVNASPVPPNGRGTSLRHVTNSNHVSNNDLGSDEIQSIVNGLIESVVDTGNINHPAITPALNNTNLNVIGNTDDSTNCLEPNTNFANFDSGSPPKAGTERWALAPTETDISPMLNDQSFEYPKPVDNVDSDDDFGDFECSNQHTSEVPEFQAPITSEVVKTKFSRNILECLLSRLESSLDKAFELPPDTVFDNLRNQFPTDCTSFELNSCPGSNDSSQTKSDTSNDQIWHKLCNPDRIPELRQHWWKSSIYASFLHSLNINPGNAMPAFASQLRLLEPVRLDKPTVGNTVQQMETANNVNISDSRTNNQPTDGVNISKPTSNENTTNESTVAECSNSSANTELNGIVSLDLDFFENQLKTASSETSQSKGAISMLNDLEAEFLCQTIQPPPPTTISLLPSLTSNQSTKRSTLSETVLNTLSRLPKLAYMRSARLMFPVQGQEQSLTK